MKKNFNITYAPLWIVLSPIIALFFVSVSPFYLVHRLVHWASEKSEKQYNEMTVAIG